MKPEEVLLVYEHCHIGVCDECPCEKEKHCVAEDAREPMRTIRKLIAERDDLSLKLGLMQVELDAAKRDMKAYADGEGLNACQFCKWGNEPTPNGHCASDDCFEWRGVCAENRGADND